MRIWEINAALEELLNQQDPETGELTCDLDALEALTIERDEKLEGLALYCKNLTAEAEAIRNEEKALAERRKALENKAARAKDFLDRNLAGEKFQTAKVAVNYRSSKAVVLLPGFAEWAKQHDKFLRYKEPEPDKTAITAALKAGDKDLAGYAELVETRSMSIK